MRFDEYQELAGRTAGTFSEEERITKILISTLGLAGEAGEVADFLKKIYGHNHTFDVTKLKKELGDVLWYVADICTKFGIDMDEVAALNIEKLRARYPNGFDPVKSQNRKPGDV
jgi:NTP pyrophosphatase (non-canonical NTP hydrolase)